MQPGYAHLEPKPLARHEGLVPTERKELREAVVTSDDGVYCTIILLHVLLLALKSLARSTVLQYCTRHVDVLASSVQYTVQ